ncbi:MAG: ADP-ribosylglycohydrolase family protein [Pirellula sp.]|jgi:hypothetical protein|nr:ADP-ribosylglycohydrolase family protein [Pirellula sp.]
MSLGAKISNTGLSLSWEQTAIAFQRERAAEGMILGAAIAESLAIPRNGVSKWTALRVFGRSPLGFQYVPGLAIPGENTHALLMTMQAIFQSRADHRIFGKSLKKRIGLYRTARVLGHAKDRLTNSGLLGGATKPDYGGVISNPLIRAAAVSLLVQGAAHARSWLEQSNQCTANVELSAGPAMLIAQSMQIAQLYEADQLNGPMILQCLIDSSDYPALKSQLELLAGYVAKRYSVAKVAKRLGYSNGVPRKLDAIALLSVYAWVRHLNRFRLAVERASLLGGECASVAAIAGALSGASLGKKSIPPEWRKALRLYPYNREWIQNVILRVKDWPHGVEDIQAAHSEPSYPIGQLTRNVGIGCFQLVHTMIRIPTMVLPKKRIRKPKS